ncbi:unnamed protein product [Prorocentrum cordatum]|uniref:Uncharacterized protein n=1 Tax=Prorocentrum cordatum TaxID=2364126 RepID=A0ABN9PLA9_9DINO|nr:unnamed protein product [Polarella glacialis]
MPDRTQRLLAVLPAVDRALAEERNFLDRAKDVWTDLRRGLLDVKQDPEQLEGMRLPDGNIMDNLWEFIMKLVAASPKHTKQVLEVLPVLLTPATPRWADAFRRTPGKGRLSLWRLAASPASQAEFDKVVDVTLQLLALKVPADELLPSEEVAAAPDFVRELLGRARAQGGVAWEGLRASGLGALRLEGGAETERAAESNAAAEPEALSNAAAGEAWTPSPATLAAAESLRRHPRGRRCGYAGEAAPAVATRVR